MDERLVEQVQQLDQQGRSAKAIAKTLGVGVRDVVGVLNGAVQVSVSGYDEPRCWVNAGWSRSVNLAGAPQWARLDPGASDAEEVRGLVAVLVAADSTRSAKAQVAGFLLDVYRPLPDPLRSRWQALLRQWPLRRSRGSGADVATRCR
ncbi:hypothetical protein [Streptomyces noursei]|uniref:hypothetical protein n=1 Tax=Streptomyces noursei TaxID=1971 RepID=UPI0011AF4DD1|nr:hypothetical protein [Streptomyces noursei]